MESFDSGKKKSTPHLRTERLAIGPLERGDAPALLAYRADPAVSRYQSWAPNALEDAIAFIARGEAVAFGTPGHWFSLAVRRSDGETGSEEAGALLGDLGVHFLPTDAGPEVPRQVEIGFTIAPSQQRNGYGVEAVTALLDHLFGPMAMHRVSASVDPRNAASLALLARVGLRQEAHHRKSLWFKGEWADDVIFALLRSEWRERRP